MVKFERKLKFAQCTLAPLMSLSLFHDTIAAISTAEGRAALGIVRISGQSAIHLVSKIVSDPENLLVARTGASIYTEVQNPLLKKEWAGGGHVGIKTTPQPPPSLGGGFIDDV